MGLVEAKLHALLTRGPWVVEGVPLTAAELLGWYNALPTVSDARGLPQSTRDEALTARWRAARDALRLEGRSDTIRRWDRAVALGGAAGLTVARKKGDGLPRGIYRVHP